MSMTTTLAPMNFLGAAERIAQLGQAHPAWFQDYEDRGHEREHLGILLATAPDPFLAGVIFGRIAAAATA